MNILAIVSVFVIGITVKNFIANRFQERAAIGEAMDGRLS